MSQKHIADLIMAAGGQALLGAELGIGQQSVSKWLLKGQIPAHRVHAALAAAQRIRARYRWPVMRLPAPADLHPGLAPVEDLAQTDRALIADLL